MGDSRREMWGGAWPPLGALRGAVAEWFALYWDELYRYLRVRYVNDDSDAEEVAQVAFVRLAELPAPDKVDDPRAFLFATARNLAVDHARKNRVRRGYLQSVVPLQADDASTVCEPERVAIGRERLERLGAAVAALPRRQRAVLLLYRLDGLSYAQIARKMRMSETTVRRCMARALETIHARLRADGLFEE